MTGGIAAASAIYDPAKNTMTIFGGAIQANIVANGAAGSPAGVPESTATPVF
jgi:hypothetical protein